MAVWAVALSTMDLIAHSLTPRISLNGIRSLVRVGTPHGALVSPVLYLRPETSEAIPKYISGRTSYHGI